MDERLVVNVSRFPHETADGETILIDAETGHVLLLTGFAAVLWGHLVGCASSEAVGCASETILEAAEACPCSAIQMLDDEGETTFP